MSETPSQHPKERSFFEKLSDKLFHEHLPETKEEFIERLHLAHGKKILNEDALHMIEGVLQVAELRADDLMVPRADMKVIDISEDPTSWIKQVINAGHSRYPVVDGDRDNVVGILLAKDLLRLFLDPQYQVRDHLRAPVFVPESKPVDILLKEFRLKRNHLALVIDEFGSVSGLITIEDVLEEIVGEIDDEFDVDESSENIVPLSPGKWRVKASTHIEDFNSFFGTDFSDDHYETVGGLVSDELEHVPHVGEVVALGGFKFKVTKALARRVQMLLVEKLEEDKKEHSSDVPSKPLEDGTKN